MRLIVTFLIVGSIAFVFIYAFTTSSEKPSGEEGIGRVTGARGAIRGMGKVIGFAKGLADEHDKRRKADEIGEREAMGDYSYSPGGEHYPSEERYVEEEIDFDSLTPLEYVKHFVRSHCSPDIGFIIKCTIHNEGERGLSGLTVRVRTSTHTLDTVDYADSQYEPHDIKLDGPFPAGERVTETVDMPDKKTEWVSDRTTVIDAIW